MRPFHRIGGLLLAAGALLLGCAGSDSSSPDQPRLQQANEPRLQQANQALQQKRYDQVISITSDCLRGDASGPAAAAAWYLRGRAIDERPKTTSAGVVADLQEARSSYIKALGFSPWTALEANIRNDLANVAYQQGDYAVAEQQWLLACERFEQPTNQAWALYRAGVCRQRVGQFMQADALFAAVQQKFPNSEPAKRAREHQGARGFYVQVAAVASSAAADNVVAAVRKLGVVAISMPPKPGQGLFTVVVGPHASYAQAEATKRKLAGQYPDALIVP